MPESEKLHLRLTIDVIYDLSGTDPEVLERNLEHIAHYASEHDVYTDGTEAKLDNLNFRLDEVLPEVVCVECGRCAADKCEGDPCEKCSGELVELSRACPERHGDECPECESGTLERADNELRCRGECGSVTNLDNKRPSRQVSLNDKECDDSCPGWGMFYRDGEGVFDIERCDVCQRFKDDDQALAHVMALESFDLARQMLHDRKELHSWLKDEVQMARLLSELLAHMEISMDTETEGGPYGYFSVKISDLCESMDLEWARILELFHRADMLFDNMNATVKTEELISTIHNNAANGSWTLGGQRVTAVSSNQSKLKLTCLDGSVVTLVAKEEDRE